MALAAPFQVDIPTALLPTWHVSPMALARLSETDRMVLEKLLTEPVDYVKHPCFTQRGIEKKLFNGPPVFESETSTHFVPPPCAVAARMMDTASPTLTAAEEQFLFKRLNYARRQAREILDKRRGQRLNYSTVRTLLGWWHRALYTRGLIVRYNIPLVLAMSKRTRLSSVDHNDLVSEGNMALLRSVEKFDCSRGFKFSTYACRAILKSFSRVAMRTARYRGRFGVEFDPALEKSDFIERKRESVEADCVDELRQILVANVADLSDVERTVIRERFALAAAGGSLYGGPKTLEQVGMIIGVTKERVRQIQNKALRKIRLAFEDGILAA